MKSSTAKSEQNTPTEADEKNVSRMKSLVAKLRKIRTQKTAASQELSRLTSETLFLIRSRRNWRYEGADSFAAEVADFQLRGGNSNNRDILVLSGQRTAASTQYANLTNEERPLLQELGELVSIEGFKRDELLEAAHAKLHSEAKAVIERFCTSEDEARVRADEFGRIEDLRSRWGAWRSSYDSTGIDRAVRLLVELENPVLS